jgi:hypothetical protein
LTPIPAVATLKPQSLFTSTYSRGGQVIAYDLAFPRTEKNRLRALLEKPYIPEKPEKYLMIMNVINTYLKGFEKCLTTLTK